MDCVDTAAELHSDKHLTGDERIIIQTMRQTMVKGTSVPLQNDSDNPEQQLTMKEAGASLPSIMAPSIAVKLEKVKKHTDRNRKRSVLYHKLA